MDEDRFLPERAPIDSYGNGGFRFAGMSHQGSLLVLPSGMRAWRPGQFSDVAVSDFDRVFAEAAGPDFLIFGTGLAGHIAPRDLVTTFANAGLGLEVMTTGAAVRTYNMLLAEKRNIAAAILAVETVR